MVKFKLNKPNIKLNKSVALKVTVAVVVIIGLVLLGSAVGSHWQKQKQIKADQAQKVAALEKAKVDAYHKAIEDAKLYKTAYETSRVNCEKGASIYANTLTPAQKLAVQKLKAIPTCPPAVPQP